MKNYSGDKTYGNRFTVRRGQAGEKGTYGWQTSYGVVIDEEVECVCPGWVTAGNEIQNGIPRENGNYYKTSWETVTSNPLPRILMVVAFNDYNEHLAVFPSESGECNNTTEEQWRNADGELDNDMYWDMTVEGIKEIRRINGEVKADIAIDERFILWCAVIATAALTVVAAVAVVIVAVRLKKSGK